MSNKISTAARPAGNTGGFAALLAMVCMLATPSIEAGPYLEPGDLALRHDIQLLADHGIIKGPTTTWPLAWGPILNSMRDVDASTLSPMLADAFARVRSRARWETRTHEFRFDTTLAVADGPTAIRGFERTPRGNVQATAGIDWIDDWLSIDLNVQGVDSDQDSRDVRIDNSMVGVVVGNWSVSASTQERWWGPGWDGSLILSNNARPIPSLVVDRIFTEPFESKWLSWIGPWDLTVMFGQLEEDRFVPNAQFFGMRVNFRPFESLEFGVFRTAQWCGDDRPCDLGTFVDLFIGRDNLGEGDITRENEPGNQLAGVDFRWRTKALNSSLAVYGQFVGEDEAGGLPSRWMGQLGAEWSGYIGDRWSTKAYAEFAATSCQFYESSELFNCVYNNGIYQTGYRYRSRSIGHGADNDARVLSFGAVLADADETSWQALLRYGKLNRGGAPDSRNTLTPTPQDLASIDVLHSRAYSFGVLAFGAGIERVDNEIRGQSNTIERAFVEWRSSF